MLEGLNRYDRATVALWARSHAELSQQLPRGCLAEAAVHAVLSGLRACPDAAALLARYEAQAQAEFALIDSLTGAIETGSLCRLRDAAFYLRWLELGGNVTGICSTSRG